jgi:Tfp pilus assembly protein PilF
MTAMGRWLLSYVRGPGVAGILVLTLLTLAVAGRHFYLHWLFERHFQDAQCAEERFDFESARKQLTECLRIRPRHAQTRLCLARNARRLGDYLAAQAELDAYRKIVGVSTPESILEAAMLLAQQGDLSSAENFLCQRLQQEDPQTSLILEALSRGGIRVYRLQDALRWAEELLARQPDNVPALIACGMIQESIGHTEKALGNFQTALNHQPEHAEARLQLADTLLRLKRPAEALGHLERLRTDRPSEDATLALARCYHLLGRLDEATALLEPLVAEHPKVFAVLAERGRTALAADRLAESEDWLRRAVAIAPMDRAANYDLACCLQRRGKRAEAERYFQRSEELHRDLKQLAEAADRAMQAPKDPQPRLRAGLICLRNGQDRQGLRWLFGALQVDPAHRPTHQALAAYYERSGQEQQATHHRRLACAPKD